jgi:1,4-alpha-glucan branching enzyme
VRDLNALYRSERALHTRDFTNEGFEWVDFHDWEESVIAFLRRGTAPEDVVLVVCNFTPVPRHNYRVGVPSGGFWKELLNSDAQIYGGSGVGNYGGLSADPISSHGRPFSLNLTLPPLGIIFFKPEA